ncbi:hypothetical protein GA397_28230, partial [Bacteroides xylanisolvens]
INNALYYRNLFQRSLHGPLTMSIFAAWIHSLKNFAINIRYRKLIYRLYWAVWKKCISKRKN